MSQLSQSSRIRIGSLLLVSLACTPNEVNTGSWSQGDGSADETGSGTQGTGHGPASDSNTEGSNESSQPAGCGDGVLTSDEACDDGNNADDDGCSADCLMQTTGYTCYPPGQPCRQITRCGDGLVKLPELCDDGNVESGDGCSATCKVEIGYKCEGDPLSVCTQTVCGDGQIEGAESCDDSNDRPLDGCNELCQKEPECPNIGPCSSECGDGLVLNELCDDGNTIAGDGCSPDCMPEDGFMCLPGDDCYPVGDQCAMRVHVIYRDFAAAHPDFEPNAAYGCTTDGSPPFTPATKITFNMVGTTWDADAKPTYAAANCATPQTFEQWYRDVPGTNTTLYSNLVLFPNGAGGYVNRYGENGEKWVSLTNYQWVAPTFEECEADGCVPCQYSPTQPPTGEGCTATRTEYDGTPLFFPPELDAIATETFPARVPEQYGYVGWPLESQVLDTDGLHNFHFTSEITYWFIYDASSPATLEFTGDDDVWVFVNGTRALDLGGIHVPIDGTLTINPASATTFGLADGNAYRVKVFHAERKTDGSSFRLTLSGFDTARSDCTPVCGDGVAVLGEECDDGRNEGGYGQCAPGCVLGEYCGDGIIQDGYEDCDDGNFIDDDACPASCRIIVIP